MGEVTADMLSGMQKLTEPMLGEFIESVGDPAGAIIEAYKKDVGR